MHIATALCACILWVMPVVADDVIVVMTTGERFATSEVWEEDGKIRFNMQGLMVSVKNEEVAGIIRNQISGYSGTQPRHSAPTSTADDVKKVPLPSSPRTVPGQHPTRAQNPYKPLHADGHKVPDASRTSSRKYRASEEIGLDGLVWRMPSEQITGLVKVETDEAFGGIDQHWRPDQPMTFNDVDLTGLVYGFWNNQLYSVMMWADGRIGYDRLRNAVFARYGPGRQNNPNVERYVWAGEETQRMLELDIKRNTGIFIMRAGRLHAHIKQLYPD